MIKPLRQGIIISASGIKRSNPVSADREQTKIER
jgi:hypothetical protein